MSDNLDYSSSTQEDLVRKPESTTALISLIAGILGLTVIPILGSIIAVLTGAIATKEIKESGGALSGEGIARIGTILGWVGIGMAVLGACMAGVIFAFSLCLITTSVGQGWGSLLALAL
jgi:hypothetical protein